MKYLNVLTLLAISLLIFSACSDDDDDDKKVKDGIFYDGTYQALDAEFTHGWKAVLEITIEDDKLTAVDFDYLDEDGNLKTETTAEEYPMEPHPSVWIPQYEASLMEVDIINYSDIDAITGATVSGGVINTLMNAILKAARDGGDKLMEVELE